MSAVRDCLFNTFAATLHTGGRSSNRNLRTRHVVVTPLTDRLQHTTHVHWQVAWENRIGGCATIPEGSKRGWKWNFSTEGKNNFQNVTKYAGRDGSVGIASPGIESRWGKIFRSPADRLCDSPSLAYSR